MIPNLRRFILPPWRPGEFESGATSSDPVRQYLTVDDSPRTKNTERRRQCMARRIEFDAGVA